MKFWPLIASTIFLMAIEGCSVKPARQDSVTVTYELSVVPNDSMRRFELELRSLSDGPLCLKISNWPDSSGRLLSDDSAILEIGDGTLSPIPSEMGRENCVTGCDPIELNHRQTLRGSVNYAAFGDPGRIAGMEKKKLILKSDPHACTESDYESSEDPNLQSLCKNGLISCDLTK